MKKFFAAVCCVGLMALNVSAQEKGIVEAAPESDSVMVEAAPAAEGSVVEGAAQGCATCGQSAPVFAGIRRGCSSCCQPAPATCCDTCAPPAPVDPCCCNSRTRPQVISRVRGRFTSTRCCRGSRRTRCCN